eukprot:c9959_g1_i2 orf=1-204(-)
MYRPLHVSEVVYSCMDAWGAGETLSDGWSLPNRTTISSSWVPWLDIVWWVLSPWCLHWSHAIGRTRQA